jgi:hypothetical protein
MRSEVFCSPVWNSDIVHALAYLDDSCCFIATIMNWHHDLHDNYSPTKFLKIMSHLYLLQKLPSLHQDTVQECCNANFGPGSHVDDTCDYVDICYEAPPEKPEMSMKWDVVESFGESSVQLC